MAGAFGKTGQSRRETGGAYVLYVHVIVSHGQITSELTHDAISRGRNALLRTNSENPYLQVKFLSVVTRCVGVPQDDTSCCQLVVNAFATRLQRYCRQKVTSPQSRDAVHRRGDKLIDNLSSALHPFPAFLDPEPRRGAILLLNVQVAMREAV